MAKILAYLSTEKPLIANLVQAVIGLVTAFGFHLTSDQAGAWMAASAALLTAVTAALTRPLQASAFTGLVTAAGVLVASYGAHLSTSAVGSVNFLITSVFALLPPVVAVATVKRMQAAGEPRIDYDLLARKIAARLAPTRPHAVQPDKM